MRKAVYLLFVFASFAASALGINKPEVRASPAVTDGNALTSAASGKLYFADVLEAHSGGGLIAAHYSHRSHSSHQSHQSHYSSRY